MADEEDGMMRHPCMKQRVEALFHGCVIKFQSDDVAGESARGRNAAPPLKCRRMIAVVAAQILAIVIG